MPIRPEDVPSDPARLAAMVLALDAEDESLRAIVRTLKDLLFGARSEKAVVIDVDQLPLDLADLAIDATPPAPPANDEGVRKVDRPRRPVEPHALSLEDLSLPIQRDVPRELGDRDMGDERGCGHATLDQAGRAFGLDNRS